jgi:hypothetical protein
MWSGLGKQDRFLLDPHGAVRGVALSTDWYRLPFRPPAVGFAGAPDVTEELRGLYRLSVLAKRRDAFASVRAASQTDVGGKTLYLSKSCDQRSPVRLPLAYSLRL